MMKSPPGFSLAILLLCAAGPVAAGRQDPVPAPGAVRIMTTIFPIFDITRTVAGDRAVVDLLLPPGAEVHTWQPSFGDVRKLASLDAFISIGSGLEPWAGDLLRGAGRSSLRSLEIGRTLPLVPLAGPDPDGHIEAHGGADPHVWLDPVLAAAIADTIADFLARLDPPGTAGFRTRAGALKSELGRLDRDFRSSLGDCRSRTFIYCGHSAFGYLARRYGLEQVAVFGSSPDAAPTPRELAAVIDRAKSAGIRTVFFEPGIGEKMARMIASEAGADTRPLSAGHNLTPAEIKAGRTFIEIMRTNLENLRHGLSCR